MSTKTEPRPETATASVPPLCHVVCRCSPWLGLCGTRVVGIETLAPIECVVCAEMEGGPCPRCGV